MKILMRSRWACTALMVCLCLQSIHAQQTYPTFSNINRPNPAPSAPGDSFSPNLQGSGASEAPEVAEWTRSGGPDQSLVLTGGKFSRFSGSEEGKDTRFTVYGANGTIKDAAIQRLDGDKAIITLPHDLPRWSMYLIWPGNDAGYGSPIAVNKTEAWWVGPDNASRGATISVYGRNLARNNDTTTSYVYIKQAGSGAGKWAQVKRVNPYRVEFVVPEDLSNGTYEVWTHNGHGGDYGWSGPIQLTINDAAQWNATVYNVKDYGAKGDGITDDVNAIRSAIQAARNNPGSTVYFPAGTYMVSNTIEAGNKVRWKGDGRDRTVIKCASNFSTSSYGLVFGNVNTFEINDMGFDVNRNFRGTLDKPIFLRGSSNVRITNVRFACQGYAIMDLHLAKYIFMENTEHIGTVSFLGSCSQLFIHRNSFLLTNDTDHMLHSWGGAGISMTASTCRDLDNSNPNNGDGWGKGRFFVGQGTWGTNRHTYLAENVTTDLAPRPGTDQNSGEQFLWEGNFGVWGGNCSGATANTATLSGFSNDNNTSLMAVIVRGKGIGQSRKIKSTSGGVITVEEPWTVVPDNSSYISVGKFIDRIVVYNNYLDGKISAVTASHGIAATGIEPFGGAVNFIADNNTLNELRQGIMNWSTQHEYGIDPAYFSFYANNKMINCRTPFANFAGTWLNAPSILGTMFRNNEVRGASDAAVANHMNTSAFPVIDASVYEKNAIYNVPIGFLTSSSGLQNQIMYKNTVQGTMKGSEMAPNPCVRENQFQGFQTNYSGTSLGSVIEAPFHVLEVDAEVGGSAVQKNFTLWNAGTSTMSWSITSNTPWLTISEGSGSIQDEKSSSNVGFSINPQALPAGTHKGYFTINAAGKSRVYSVQLNVKSGTTKPNTAPTVNVTAPAANATFSAPASINITADAADADGQVQRVEFWSGTTKLGEDLTAPYTFAWNNVPAGTYSITAKAFDNGNLNTTSAAIAITVKEAPQAPVVSLTSPTANAVFTAPATVTIEAAASNNDGTVTLVEFFNGSTKLGQDSSAPYALTLKDLAAGTYNVTAKATNNSGQSAVSGAVNFTVNAPVAKVAPVVSIASGTDLSNLVAPASIRLTANATDKDGSVTLVEFFNGSQKVGEDNTSPYELALNNLTAGNYSFTAKATDNDGMQTTSQALAVTVKAAPVAPSVQVSVPGGTQNLVAPANIGLAATASDNDGQVVKVEFFANGQKIGEDLSSPYQFTWSNVQAGTYSITAKATDNSGLSTVSQAISLTVSKKKKGPAVSLSKKTTTTLTAAATSVTLEASATSEEGTISKVEFYKDGVFVSETTTAPYIYSASSLQTGVYNFTAKAIDSDGLSSQSEPVQVAISKPEPVAPVVTLAASKTTATTAEDVVLSAKASDADGSIVKVEFFAGTEKFGEDLSAPYEFTGRGFTAGTFQVVAKATDNSGLTSVSNTITVTITNAANVAPVVSIQNPISNSNYVLPATIQVTANASDKDGSVAKVEFFANTVKIGESKTAPYRIDWKPTSEGTYLITARATDNQGLATTAASVPVSVYNNKGGKGETSIIRAYPNPFSNQSTVELSVPARAYIVANLVNQRGDVVSKLYQGVMEQGQTYKFKVDGTRLPNGTYTISVMANDGKQFFNQTFNYQLVLAR